MSRDLAATLMNPQGTFRDAEGCCLRRRVARAAPLAPKAGDPLLHQNSRMLFPPLTHLMPSRLLLEGAMAFLDLLAPRLCGTFPAPLPPQAALFQWRCMVGGVGGAKALVVRGPAYFLSSQHPPLSLRATCWPGWQGEGRGGALLVVGGGGPPCTFIQVA